MTEAPAAREQPTAAFSADTTARQDRVEQELERDRRRGSHRHCGRGRATAGSASSCRRSSGWRTISSWSPRPRPRPRRSACRSTSRAMRRRTIRASTSSGWRPIPASSRSTSIPPRAGATASRRRTAIYEEARQSRLGADKFMIDGRHAGTGGGNHVVVGGATPDDSPFLRRPGSAQEPGPLLAAPSRRCPTCSPACSSGRPARRRASTRRVTTALYELEIALAQVPQPGQGDGAAAVAGRPALPQPPGRRHRQHPSLRDLHRQALFARRPDRAGSAWSSSAASRCRPIARMSLAQQLLGPRHRRAAVAGAARRPFRALGHGAARPLHAAASTSGRTSSTCSTISRSARLCLPAGMVRGAARVPLPLLRRGRDMRASSSNSGRRSSPGT